MTELLTAAQMRAIEAAAMESGAVTGLELMERAGRGTVEAILAEWPELASDARRAVVLCGPGNNGGDGFVVARLLKERGWAVEVFLYGDADKLPPDARANYERWSQGGDIRPLTMPKPTPDEVDALDALAAVTVERPAPDLVVDALFGIGLARPIEALEAMLSEVQLLGPSSRNANDEWWPRVVALDIPSGLCADSGRALGGRGDCYLGATLTVAYGAAKRGHFLDEGPAACGRLRLMDLGLPDVWDERRRAALAALHGLSMPGAKLGRVVAHLDHPDWFEAAHLRKASGHKYHHGHALILSGGPGRGGAARMAARGALRIGAGLVTLGCPRAALQENASRVDAVMTRSLRGAEGLAAMLEDDRLGALALGPGLGTGDRQAALVRVALGGGAGVRGANEDRGPGSGAGAASSGGDGEPLDHGAPGPTRGLDQPGAMRDRGPGSEAEAPGADGGRLAPGPADAPGEGGGRPVPGRDDGGLPPGEPDGRPAEGGGGGRPPQARRPAVVLDADALTILAREPDLLALLHDRCVLTPHAGEFARLFPDIAERLDAPAETGPAISKVDAAREAAARAGCVVLLKGADTVIAHPDGRAAINSAHYERSAPWLATAGAGDVLTGFIAGLLARGLAPMQAAEAAAWLHVECALEFGPGLIAEDLPEMLPRVFRRLGV